MMDQRGSHVTEDPSTRKGQIIQLRCQIWTAKSILKILTKIGEKCKKQW